jgi:DNA-binding LytR/AlgR family response regulator
MVKAIVAEDEALLRRSLLDALRETWPELEIVAECEDGASALEAIDAHRPEVAFLDIRMPGLTGLEVASVASEVSPSTQVVFVTAYDQYAIDAFESGAIDYLLKPIAADRLAATVKRVQGRLVSGVANSDALSTLIRQLGVHAPAQRDEPPLRWVTASTGRELDPAVFKQIHRSTIVNMKAVVAVSRDDTGKGSLRLRGREETLAVSQPFMTLFRNM